MLFFVLIPNTNNTFDMSYCFLGTFVVFEFHLTKINLISNVNLRHNRLKSDIKHHHGLCVIIFIRQHSPMITAEFEKNIKL